MDSFLLFGLPDSSVKLWAICGIQTQIYCWHSQNMALIRSIHGPNMVILIGHNIDMSTGPINLSTESFISLESLEN